MKAYICMETYEYTGGVVFAETNLGARKIAANKWNEGELGGLSVRRAPDLDRYAETRRVPAWVLICKHGWNWEGYGDGIALVPDRTSAPWWQSAARRADAILFVDGKIKFERPDGTVGKQPGTGTCLLAVGLTGMIALGDAEKAGLGIVMEHKRYVC